MTHRAKYIARIALFAFLLNAILPFFAVYNVSKHDISNHQAWAKEISPLFGEKVLICTGDGFKWVKWEDLQGGKEKHPSPSHYQCALCYAAAHGLKDIITPDTVTLASMRAGALSPAIHVHLSVASYPHSPHHSRAPPTPFFS